MDKSHRVAQNFLDTYESDISELAPEIENLIDRYKSESIEWQRGCDYAFIALSHYGWSFKELMAQPRRKKEVYE